METIAKEGSIRLKISVIKKISKQMGIFYNPVMSLNRDISVLLVNLIGKNNMQIADPLAASGVRSIRFLRELNKGKIRNISINDINESAVKTIKENLTLNNVRYKNNKKIRIFNEDANLFLLNSKGFDYIDIDPFGSPNFLLNNSIVRLARGGILAVTATDTSALCGTFPNACRRKYWALPRRDSLMHETGLRILIRKIQLVGAQYDKALAPIFSYSKEHYMRVFLKNCKGKDDVDAILKLHGMFNAAGPMWLGRLWEPELASNMLKNAINSRILNKNNGLVKFLETIKEESKIDAVGFYDLNGICEKNNIKKLQKKELIKNKIKNMGYKASDTHFKSEGVKSGIPLNKLVRLLKNK